MRSSRRAFSLLELILALALTVGIFSAIAASFHVFLKTVTEQQREIEQHQVARNVMAIIGNDIRAALQYKPVDVTGVENLAASELLVAGIIGGESAEDIIAIDALGAPEAEEDVSDVSGGAGSSSSASGSGSSNVSSGSDGSDELTEEEIALADCVDCRPTLIGTETALTVDVSRLPRLDEYNPLVASNSEEVQLPSDLKAISYFIGRPSAGDNSGRNSLFSDQVNELGGLYRRNIDRAVANYAGEEGIMDFADSYADLISPEVVELTFRYFDGEQWNTEWDNFERGGFPLAVEIVVTMDPNRLNSDDPDSYSGFDPNTMQRYRSVVNLPVSEIIEPEG